MTNTMRVTYRDGTGLNVRVPPEGLERVLALHGWESCENFARELEYELTGAQLLVARAAMLVCLRNADLDRLFADWR